MEWEEAAGYLRSDNQKIKYARTPTIDLDKKNAGNTEHTTKTNGRRWRYENIPTRKRKIHLGITP